MYKRGFPPCVRLSGIKAASINRESKALCPLNAAYRVQDASWPPQSLMCGLPRGYGVSIVSYLFHEGQRLEACFVGFLLK